MARKRKVGPGGGDFALNPNRFDYSGGGGGRRGGASIIKKARKETAKPESSMKTKKKATRTRRQLERLDKKLDEALYNQLFRNAQNKTRRTPRLKKSPDARERVNIQAKGGLREDVKAFKNKLDKQDKADTNAVRAYRFLQKSKHNQLKKGDEGYRDSFSDTMELQNRTRSSLRHSNFMENFRTVYRDVAKSPKDPTVRKVIRKNKKLVKEEFKKQIKKDRAKRKLDESKKRRQRK